MSKLTVAFYGFALLVIALFAVFSYLMTTVNPDGPPKSPPSPDYEDSSSDNEGKLPETPDEGTGRKFNSRVPEWWSSTASSNVTFSATSERTDRKSINATSALLKSSKERRSINDLWKKNDKGVIIMKIFGDDGKPRVEIVFHPKRPKDVKWNNNVKTNNLYPNKKDPKRRNNKFIYNSVVNIMPDDTVILENADYSLKDDLESNDKIPETTKKIEYTKDVSESIWIEKLKTSKYVKKGPSPIINRSAATLWYTTVKTEITSTENIEDAFDSHESPEDTTNTIADIADQKEVNSVIVSYINNTAANTTNTLINNAYEIDTTSSYTNQREAIGIAVSNVNNEFANASLSINNVYEIENVTYADQKEVIDVTVSNVMEIDNLTPSVVTENDFYDTGLNLTTATLYLGDGNGTASTNATLSEVGNTDADVIKTSEEISSDNTDTDSI